MVDTLHVKLFAEYVLSKKRNNGNPMGSFGTMPGMKIHDESPLDIRRSGEVRLLAVKQDTTPLRPNKRMRRSFDDSVPHPEIMSENSVAACTLIHLSHQSGQWDHLDAMVSVYATTSGALLLRSAFHALEIEVAQTPSEELLFRCDSFCTSYLGVILRRWGHKFLRRQVAPIIKRIDGMPSLEIDPSVLPKWHPELLEASEQERMALQESLLETNRGRLVFVANEFIEQITQTIDTIHPLISFILLEVYNRVHSVFPRSATRSLGAILFLRFIFPAFTLPDHHELITTCSPSLRRKLVIVAKLLQCVFNEVPRRDEDYFMPLAPFIAKHMDTNKILYEKLLVAVQALPPGLNLLSESGSRRSKSRSRRRTKEELKQIMVMASMFVQYADESAQYASRKDILAHLSNVWIRQGAVMGTEVTDVHTQVQEESRAFLKWLRTEVGGLGALSPHTLRYHSSDLPTPRLDGVLEVCQALMRTETSWNTFQSLLQKEATEEVLELVEKLPSLPSRSVYLLPLSLLVPALQHLLMDNPILDRNRRLETFFQVAANQTSDDRSHGPFECPSVIRELTNLRSTTLSRFFVLLSLWEVLLRPVKEEASPFLPPVAVETFGSMLFEDITQEGVLPFLRTIVTHRQEILNALPPPSVWSIPSGFGSIEHSGPALEPMTLRDWQFLALGAIHEKREAGEEVIFDSRQEEMWRVLCGRVEVVIHGVVVTHLMHNDYWYDLDGRLPSHGVIVRVVDTCVLQRIPDSWTRRLSRFQPALYTRLHFALTQSRALRSALDRHDLYLHRRAGRLIRNEESRLPLEVHFSDGTSQWVGVQLDTTAKGVCDRIARSVERGHSFRERMFGRLYERFANPVSGERQFELLEDQWTVQTILTRAKYAQDHRLCFVTSQARMLHGQPEELLSTAFVVAQAACRFKKNKGTLMLLPRHLVFQRASSSGPPEKEIRVESLQWMQVNGDVLEVSHPSKDLQCKFVFSSEEEAQRIKQVMRSIYTLGEPPVCSPMVRSATASKLAVVIQCYQAIEQTGISVKLAETVKVLNGDSDRLLVENSSGKSGFVPQQCLHVLTPLRGQPYHDQLVHHLTMAQTDKDIVGRHTPGVEEWQKLLAGAHLLTVPAGETILYRGEPSESVYFVVEGACEAVNHVGQAGQPRLEGDGFGYSSLFVGFVPHDVLSRGAKLLHVEASYLRALFSFEGNEILAAHFFAWVALQLTKISLISSEESG